MADTPEGKVKKAIKKVLAHYAPAVWYYMSVGNGMGKPTLDFMGSAWGRAFAIEAKAPGKKPTERQEITIEEMERAGIKVFVIDGNTADLELWLKVGQETMEGILE